MGDEVLFNERVVAVQPAAVRACGSVTGAAVLQQIHYHAQARHTSEHDGHEWVVISCAQVAGEIGLTEPQVKRAMVKLREAGLLHSCQPGGHRRTAWHRVDYEALSDSSKVRNRPFQGTKPDLPRDDSEPCTSTKRIKKGRTPPGGAAPDALTLIEGQGLEPGAPSPIAVLVARYAELYGESHGGRAPDKRWRAACGKAVREALEDGHSESDIRRALAAAARENKHPSNLGHLLADLHSTSQPRKGAR